MLANKNSARIRFRCQEFFRFSCSVTPPISPKSNTNDKQQIEPMLKILEAQQVTKGEVKKLIADAGYCSERNITACEEANIEPMIAVGRELRHPDWRERASEPVALAETAGMVEKMAHKLKTKTGRVIYATRKQTVEPVFGIIKSVMGFRKFSLRGLEKVQGEWRLVCLAWNFKRIAVLRPKFG